MAETQTTRDHDRSAVAAVGRVLAAISGSAFELEPALNQLATEAASLCRADLGFVYLRDGDVFRFAAAIGGSTEHWAYEREHPDTIDRKSVVGRVALRREPVHIADVAADREYEASAYRVGGVRTLLGVPVRIANDLIGVLGLGRTRLEPFADEEIELVTVFADQAGVAIRLARLLTETAEALKRESAVGHVLASITRSTFDLQHILDTVVESAAELSSADTANLVRDEAGEFRIAAAYGAGQKEIARIFEATQFVPDRGSLVGRALLERRTVHITDVLADPDYTRRDMQAVGGFRTALGVPLLRDGAPIGVLTVHRMEVRSFSPQEVALISTFADQAALAIANVALYQTMLENGASKFVPVLSAIQLCQRTPTLVFVIDKRERMNGFIDSPEFGDCLSKLRWPVPDL